jgi:hypothetical protein
VEVTSPFHISAILSSFEVEEVATLWLEMTLVINARSTVLYHFVQFGQHVTFPRFRKFSENQINREKIESGVKKNWGGQGTAELIEMVQYCGLYVGQPILLVQK